MQTKDPSSCEDRVSFTKRSQDLHVLSLRGVVSFIEANRVTQEIVAGLASAHPNTVLIVDCTRVTTIEPGVGGRIIAQLAANGTYYRRWVIATTNRTLLSFGHVAQTVFKNAVGQFASTLPEAFELAERMSSQHREESARPSSRGRARTESAELDRPVLADTTAQLEPLKPNKTTIAS
jgi:hypothetical protein